ncbi:Helix-turn-helix domain protein [Sulfitobacter noctilucicola]|uniref:Transcriptional regulator with XRE-family HTH domain n=1 Tax=Sulfitobacter noctilucicola TaxID=1342301 RepID=A0A7W6M8I9_9RHOB|nr:helix-turn-helix domain-containing protein [Sulfitobacter noctilucicola]KIN64393.1 Helix-turn-helix domain protein [Sulfitobacter noctilucicola]MBB4174448.1 transcriptional regulator with XRE-family HTH domain [Sulfitobacter noctilucicola]
MDTETDWYGPDAATFGDRLAAARERADMTQGMLAKRLGVKLATLRAWEDDHSEPRANRLSMLAGLLNVSMMWLINGEGEGIESPEDSTPTPVNLAEALSEIRKLRADMLASAEAMGRLEKRLRLMRDVTDNG